MGDLYRRTYDRGWVPNADAINAPANALLRADNLHLDDEGIISLRSGSAHINGSAYADPDVATLFTSSIGGSRYRLAGAGNHVYINDVQQPTLYTSSGDIALESGLGFSFAARATTKKKYSPSLGELNWGIAAPSQKPTVATLAAYTFTIASCNTGESPAFVANEGAITGVFPTGSDGTANGAIEVTPAVGTGRGTITKTFASDQDLFNIQSKGDDQDLFDMMVRIAQPEKVETITVMFGLGTGPDAFQDDYYYFDFKLGGPRPNVVDLVDKEVAVTIVQKKKRKKQYADDDGPVSINLPDDPIRFDEGSSGDPNGPPEDRVVKRIQERRRERKDMAGSGWTHLTCLRAQFNRVGSNSRNWKNVRAIKLIYKAVAGSTGTVQYDFVLFIGGAAHRALTGAFQFRWSAARFFTDANGYSQMVEFSPPSPPSDEVEFVGQGARVTIPWSALQTLDPQANYILIWFFGGFLDRWYLASQVSLTQYKDQNGNYPWGIDDLVPQDPDGAFSMQDLTRIITWDLGIPGPVLVAADLTIDVVTNDIDALIANEPLVEDQEGPPNDIVSIVGPHVNRLFVLSQPTWSRGLLYISERRRFGVFSRSVAFDIGDGAEICYWLARTTGGIFIGTSLDIYAVTGTGSEYPDGTVDFKKEGLNIGSPPTDGMIATEGNVIIYRAADGPRIFDGVNSIPIPRDDVDALYKGQTRHGVDPINLTGGRFRAALSNGILYMITPEGASTTKSSVLHCYDFRKAKWRRYTYPVSFRSIHREYDGRVIAGDDSGRLWELNTGTSDQGTAIPVVMWTPVDSNGLPLNRKDPYDLNLKLDTGGAVAAVDVHLDNSATPATTFAPLSSGAGLYKRDVSDIPAFRQWQMRLSGSFNTFKFYELDVPYRLRTQHRMMVDTGYIPILRGSRMAWVREVEILANSPVNLTVGVYFDGVLLATKPVVVEADIMRPYRVPLGRDIHGRQGRITVQTVSAAGTGEVGFEVIWVRWRLRPVGGITQKDKQYLIPELVAKS